MSDLQKWKSEESDQQKSLEQTADTERRYSPKKKKSTKKKALIIASSILLVFILAYGGFAFYFTNHFYFNTKIYGIDFGGKKVSDVEDYIKSHVANYQLTVEKRNGNTEMISASDIALKYKQNEEIQQLLEDQNSLLWIKSLFGEYNTDKVIQVEYDKEALNTKMNSLQSVIAEQESPVSAYPEYNGTEFVIVDEVLGSRVRKKAFEKQLQEHVEQLKPSLNMDENGCYRAPKFTKESPEVIAARDELNDYLKASITYDFGPNTELVDKEKISFWLSVDKNMEIVFNKEEMEAFVDELKRKYDTVGTVRRFTNPVGKKVKVGGGDFGWLIGRDAEVEALIANIQKHEVITREPKFIRRGAGRGQHDYGNTYAVVDLTEQHMWFVKNGEVVLESPVVTGLANTSRITPPGSFDLTYKTSPAVLRSPLRPDGTREYETPVSYWMPFNGNIGFHDATWQPSFGGTRYQVGGSHGCINLPLDKAEELYNLIEPGIPVICHH